MGLSLFHFSCCIILTCSFLSCIGDDYLDDAVDPELRIETTVDTLAVGASIKMGAVFFNNVGREESIAITWQSSEDQIATVDSEGLVLGISKGEVEISAEVSYQSKSILSKRKLVVDQNTVENQIDQRMGTLRTTSTYRLAGDFILKSESDELVLSFADNYITDDVLPGLYIYLTNNLNSISGAHEIARVETFEGAHSYTISSDIKINDFKYVLYYCKPFRVKVGDGKIE
jgi:hypothetical protein